MRLLRIKSTFESSKIQMSKKQWKPFDLELSESHDKLRNYDLVNYSKMSFVVVHNTAIITYLILGAGKSDDTDCCMINTQWIKLIS